MFSLFIYVKHNYFTCYYCFYCRYCCYCCYCFSSR